MNNDEQKKSIKDLVLKEIKENKTEMKPRWHFVLKATLILLGIFILSLALLYLVSFILFVLRQNGLYFITPFGFRGITIFLLSLPWILVFVSIAFLLALEVMIRKYSFSYRRPILYSLLAIFVLVTIGGFIVGDTDFHQGVFKSANNKGLPIIGPMYKGYGLDEVENICFCQINEIIDDGFMATDESGDLFKILVNDDTRFPYGMEFRIGDNVLILGDKDGDTIEAIGMRLSDEFAPRFHTKKMMPPPTSTPVFGF